MKKIVILFLVLTSTSLFAKTIQSGIFKGKNINTGEKCTIQIEFGFEDYAYIEEEKFEIARLSNANSYMCDGFDQCAIGDSVNKASNKSLTIYMDEKKEVKYYVLVSEASGKKTICKFKSVLERVLEMDLMAL